MKRLDHPGPIGNCSICETHIRESQLKAGLCPTCRQWFAMVDRLSRDAVGVRGLPVTNDQIDDRQEAA